MDSSVYSGDLSTATAERSVQWRALYSEELSIVESSVLRRALYSDDSTELDHHSPKLGPTHDRFHYRSAMAGPNLQSA